MKITVLLVLVAVISSGECRENRTKYSSITQKTEKEDDVSSKRDKSVVNAKSVSSEEYVYLEDVFYSLKNQRWRKEQERCLNQTLLLLTSLKNFTLWAVWEWDSISSEPVGLLYGNRYQLGNFDECMSSPWKSTHPELETQYCLADIRLERSDAKKHKSKEPYTPYSSALEFMQHRPMYYRPLNELTWGVCVPASCDPASVERLMSIMLARSHLGTTGMRASVNVSGNCQTREPSYMWRDAGFYSFCVVIGLLILVALACTYLNKDGPPDPRTVKMKVINAFCIRNNAKNLLSMKRDGIEVLYGIRFLNICFIVLGHQIGMSNAGPISDGLSTDNMIRSLAGMLLLHDDLFVDTFFFLSGLLTATNLLNFKRFPNPIILILRRYVRLVVALAVVVYYMSTVFPYTGNGPLWPAAVEAETGPCQKNWWLNLLMLSNYLDSDNICLVVSWYIPCDFHFFVVTVLLFWLYQRLPKLSVTCGAAIAIVSVILPGIINYVKELPAVQLFTYEFILDPRGSKQFQLTYIKSHTRFAAYVVGLVAGYIFTANKNRRIDKMWSRMGAASGVVLMLAVMIAGTLFLRREYGPLEAAVYAALDRPVWATGLAMFVLCCALGHVRMISGFLSWFPWVPLSRLVYGIYLTHSIIIIRNTFVTRNPAHNDFPVLLNSTMGTIFWGSVVALLMWLFAEAPANNLLSLLLAPRNKVSSEKNALPEGQESPQNGRGGHVGHAGYTNHVVEDRGHLQDNMSSAVNISSKV